MDVDTVLLADYASTGEQGKLNVMGVFNRIFVKKFPARHPVMYVITKVSASMAEVNMTRKLSVKLMDEDSHNTLIDFTRDVTVQQQPPGQRFELNGILRINDIILEKPGTYQISVLIDDDEKASLPLYVEPAK